jgi:hypothetical protein
MAGLVSKKPAGFSMNPVYSTGITGKSSGLQNPRLLDLRLPGHRRLTTAI